MDFDIKKIIDQAAEKLQGNDKLMEEFKSDPIKAIEGLVGVNIPEEHIKAVVTAVKAKLMGDEGKEFLEKEGKDIMGKLGGIFGKKD